jgi:hypothetical protein
MLGALIAISLETAPAGFAQGKTPVTDFAVTLTTDSASPGTLREAIAGANAIGGGTIRFAPGLAGTILLTEGELRITANVTIIGPGADTLTVSGSKASRVFIIEIPLGNAADVVTMSGLTIRDGFAGSNAVHPGQGGGIYVQGATLTLSQVALADNLAVGGSAAGGGLYGTSSIVTIIGSTISGNQAVGASDPALNSAARGGGVAFDGGSLTLDNNTLTGNQAVGGRAAGGAIAFTGGGNDTLTIDGNSISGNQAQGASDGNALGGALFVSGKLAPTRAVVRKTRLVGNIAGRSSRGGSSGGSSAGGALFVDNLASVTFVQDAMVGNLLDGPWDLAVNDRGTAVGGGAYVNTGGALTLNNTSVTLNAALPNTLVGTGAPANSAGGGVFTLSGGTLLLEGSTTVEQNFARTYSNLYLLPSGKP